MKYVKNHNFIEAYEKGQIVGKFDFNTQSYISLKTGNPIRATPSSFSKYNISMATYPMRSALQTIRYIYSSSYSAEKQGVIFNNIERLLSVGLGYDLYDLVSVSTPIKLDKDFITFCDGVYATYKAGEWELMKKFPNLPNGYRNMLPSLVGNSKDTAFNSFIEKQIYICANENCYNTIFMPQNRLVHLLREYYRDCVTMYGEAKPTKNFLTNALRILKLYEGYREREQETILKKNNTNPKLFFENDNFIVTFMDNSLKFHEEADYQQNCVERMYKDKVLDGGTYVVSIRKKSDITIPYITCEVSLDGEIMQYLGRFNRRPIEEEAQTFYDQYEAHLKEAFNN